MRWMVAVGILLAGCATPQPTPHPTPITFQRLPDVTTCQDIVTEGINRASQCARIDGTACQVFATYAEDAPQDYLMTGSVTNLESIALTNPAIWNATVIQTAVDDSVPVTLTVLGQAGLTGITPDLSDLRLDTSNQPPCPNTVPSILLVETNGDTQASLTINGAEITVSAAAFFTAIPDDNLTMTVLSGIGVLSSGGVTRVTREGNAVRTQMEGLEVQDAPGEPQPWENQVVAMIPDALLRQTPNLPVENPAASEPTTSESGCATDPAWNQIHTVRRGESLTTIAGQYDISVQALQTENCLQNPNRLAVGQELKVPGEITPTPAQNREIFTLDADTVTAGGCTFVRWNVPGAPTVLLDGLSVSARNGREVCPATTTTYTLRVLDDAGAEQTYNVTLAVISPADS